MDDCESNLGEVGAPNEVVRVLDNFLAFEGLTGYRIDEGQDSLVMAFSSSKGRDKDRNLVARDLCLRSVGTL
jgi:hypothetical protein